MFKFTALKIYYQNTRGLRTKTHSFCRQLSCESYDIVILTETWLNDSVMSAELFDSRYVVYRRDRDSKKKDGGGVLIAVLKKINSKRMCNWESHCEDLWVTVDVPITKAIRRIALCAVYLPPPVTRATLEPFLDSCSSVLEQSGLCTCIMGDFNLSCINWNLVSDSTVGYTAPGFSHILSDFTHINKLVQLNNICNSSGKVLDLALSNLPFGIASAAQNPLSKIDPLHPPLEILLKAELDHRLPYNHDNVRQNYFKADYEKICRHISEMDWEMLLDNKVDVNEMLSIFYDRLQGIIKTHVPTRRTQRRKYPPWFDRNLIRTLKEKEKIRKRYKIYKNPMDGVELKLLGTRCSHLATVSYNKYIANIETEISDNPKQFWAYIKDKRGGSSSFPVTMTDGNLVTSDGHQICQMFADQFASGFVKGKAAQHSSVSDNMRNMNNNSLPLTEPVIDRDCLIRKLKSLDSHKGAGPDGIPPIFFSKCAYALASPLLMIFNRSLSTGVFPDIWKTAKVVPIHKSGESDNVSNYRPISILCTLAKVFESLICPLIQSHLKLYLSVSQHGFVGGRSTCTNLVAFTEFLVNAIDSGGQVDVVYTDFSRAFDCVPHDILLDKLSAYGITGNLLAWLKSYLENRFFFVVVNGFQSCVCATTSGVPQGSHIGPILFIVFVNDIPECFRFSECFMYADDLKFGKVINSREDAEALQKDLDKLIEWCVNNGMDLNIRKCFHIKFTRKKLLVPSVYSIGSHVIQEVDEIKDLGVLFDKKLTFIPHLESVIKRASRMLGFVIRNASGFRRSKTKMILYNCHIRSILEYCSTVWRPHYATHKLRLERIQKRFLWHLAYSCGVAKTKPSYVTRLSYFKVSSLEKRRNIIDSTFLIKILRNKIDCPQLLEKIKFRAPARYPRVPITPFYPPPRRTVLGANSTIPRLCKLLNSCSDLVDVHADSLTKFRKLTYSLM